MDGTQRQEAALSPRGTFAPRHDVMDVQELSTPAVRYGAAVAESVDHAPTDRGRHDVGEPVRGLNGDCACARVRRRPHGQQLRVAGGHPGGRGVDVRVPHVGNAGLAAACVDHDPVAGIGRRGRRNLRRVLRGQQAAGHLRQELRVRRLDPVLALQAQQTQRAAHDLCVGHVEFEPQDAADRASGQLGPRIRRLLPRPRVRHERLQVAARRRPGARDPLFVRLRRGDLDELPRLGPPELPGGERRGERGQLRQLAADRHELHGVSRRQVQLDLGVLHNAAVPTLGIESGRVQAAQQDGEVVFGGRVGAPRAAQRDVNALGRHGGPK